MSANQQRPPYRGQGPQPMGMMGTRPPMPHSPNVYRNPPPPQAYPPQYMAQPYPVGYIPMQPPIYSMPPAPQPMMSAYAPQQYAPQYVVQPPPPPQQQPLLPQPPMPAPPPAAPTVTPSKPRTKLAIVDPTTNAQLDTSEIKKSAPATPVAAPQAVPAPAQVAPVPMAPLAAAVAPVSIGIPAAQSPRPRERKPLLIQAPPEKAATESGAAPSSAPAPTATTTTSQSTQQPQAQAEKQEEKAAAPKQLSPAPSSELSTKSEESTASLPKDKGDVFTLGEEVPTSDEEEEEEEEEEEDEHPPVVENPRYVVYPKDMWSPDNKGGDRVYPFSFLLEFRDLCTDRPVGFRTDLTQLQESRQVRGIDNLGFLGSAGNRRPAGKTGKKAIIIPTKEKVKPLGKSENRWVPTSVGAPGAAPVEEDEQTKNLKKAKGVLNKLTLQTFAQLSDKLIHLGTRISDEHMSAFIQQIFQKAIDEQFFSEMYARLCEKMSKAVHGASQNSEQPDFVLPQFRKLLLQNCQREFEKDRSSEKERLDALEKRLKERRQREEDSKNGKEVVAQSKEELQKEEEEQYKLQINRARMFGNIKFIGELFKLGIVSHVIIQRDCINPFLKDTNVEEDVLECISKLIETAGSRLDNIDPKHMDEYFAQIKKIIARKEPKLSARVKFMLMDLVELRENKWESRRQKAGPKTIDEIHQEVEKEKIQQEKAFIEDKRKGRRTSTGGDGGGRANSDGRGRGMGRQSTDGSWNTVGGGGREKREEVDGKKLGFSRAKAAGTQTLGGGRRSFTPGAAQDQKSDSGPKTSSNKFNVLDGEVRPPKPTPPPVRQVAPRLSQEDVDRKVDACLQEYISIKDVKEVEATLKDMGDNIANETLVSRCAVMSLELQDADRASLASLLTKLIGANQISQEELKNGLISFLGTFEDLSIDIPKANEYFAGILASLISSNVLPVSFLNNQSVTGLYGDAAFKLVGQVFVSLGKLTDEATAKKLYADLGVPLTNFLPEAQKAKLSDLVEKMHLGFLLSDASAGSGAAAGGDLTSSLQDLFRSGKSNDEIIAWVEANASQAVNTPALVKAIVTGLVSSVCLDASGKYKAASDEAMESAAKARTLLVMKFSDRPDLRLHVLNSLQAFSYQHGSPKGLLSSWFTYFYDLNVVEESDLMSWKGDTSDEYPGKGAALHEVKSLFEDLESAVPEKDEK